MTWDIRGTGTYISENVHTLSEVKSWSSVVWRHREEVYELDNNYNNYNNYNNIIIVHTIIYIIRVKV